MTSAPHAADQSRSAGRTSAPNVAIVGVTGAVGQEFLRVLEQRNFPIGELKMLASARSAGKSVAFRDKTYTIEELTEKSFKGVDLALFSAGGSISKKYADAAVAAGAVVVDNSSAFRMTEGVPLVVPEVNPEAIEQAGIKLGEKPGIIANPNCSTIIMLVPVTPLHKAAKAKRIIVSTYQAASGAGAAAMAELEQQSREVLEGKPPTMEIFPFQYAFNLFSHNSDMQPNGYNQEEMKMVHETHKIWNDAKVGVNATCIRVPVMRAHAESITIEFENPIDEATAREVLRQSPGVSLMDDRESNRFPTPLDASDRDNVYVGRIRTDLSVTDGRGLSLFVCGDQIRKGAALNAVQIAELLL
ncbi:aspartate-semialdehyde dehydrogenase [Phycisphaerales bacterium AB-hyl4]|uniref:Aspartate-semialdehyde dehydrogenase n=1 Tax=Natronomicrosphaera hydrolytica TaxID=3242702 RepID=A0ABV4U2P1_9BACT